MLTFDPTTIGALHNWCIARRAGEMEDLSPLEYCIMVMARLPALLEGESLMRNKEWPTPNP